MTASTGAGLERIVAGLVERIERRFYGKYRGFVVDSADPAQLGRLRLRVPSVLGPDVVTGWATPCLPYGGAPDQGLLFLPDRDAGVWVEFEEGDLEFPIWVGTFWGRSTDGSELPRPNEPDGAAQADVQDPVTRKIIKTARGHTLQFEDAPGDESVLLVVGERKHVLRLDADGIALVDGVNGHTIRLTTSGVEITERDGGNVITLASDGISIGQGAAEALVHGTTLKSLVSTFMTALNTHTHVGNLGAPTSPPMLPMQLDVPLSTKHKVG